MVVVYSENQKLVTEMLSKARELSAPLNEKVTAVLIGAGKEHLSSLLIRHGADRVVLMGASLEDLKAEEVSDLLCALVKEEGTGLLMVGSNKDGKELASRVSAKLGVGCSTDSKRLYMKDGALHSERVVFSGNGVAVEKFTSRPAVVTVPPKAFDPLPADDGRQGETVKKELPHGTYGSRTIKVDPMLSEGANVEDAEKIVSCGRGFKNSADIKLIEELAAALKGYTLGCSRPIAADLKWLSEDHWIGLSGHKVKPKLYMACGISGQVQHVAGMRDSGLIVAINKDANAPIFKVADYGIVGDLYQVLPKLINAIKQRT